MNRKSLPGVFQAGFRAMLGASQSTGVSIFVSLFVAGLLQHAAMVDDDEDFASE
jgi:hypothetical protein